jgi:hypothetical protein
VSVASGVSYPGMRANISGLALRPWPPWLHLIVSTYWPPWSLSLMTLRFGGATSCVRLSLGCGGCVHPVPDGYQHCITAVAKQITIALATTGQNLDAATLTHTLQSNATSHNLLITSFGLRELPLI